MVWWTLTDDKCKFLPWNRCTVRKGSRAGRRIERLFKHQDKKVCMHVRSLLILVKNVFHWKEMWLLEREACHVWAGGQVKQDRGLWVPPVPCMRLLSVRAELPPVGCQLQWPDTEFVPLCKNNICWTSSLTRRRPKGVKGGRSSRALPVLKNPSCQHPRCMGWQQQPSLRGYLLRYLIIFHVTFGVLVSEIIRTLFLYCTKAKNILIWDRNWT